MPGVKADQRQRSHADLPANKKPTRLLDGSMQGLYTMQRHTVGTRACCGKVTFAP